MSKLILKVALLACVVACAIPSCAQEAPHKFFDAPNIALWSGVAVAHAMDCDSTWQMLSSGSGREVELPTSLAQSRVQMSLFSIGVVGAQVGGSYLLHRLGWHRVERWSSSLHMGVTGITAIHNYGLRAQPAPSATGAAIHF